MRLTSQSSMASTWQTSKSLKAQDSAQFCLSSCGKILFPLTSLSTKKDMLNIKGITEQKAEKLYEAASKIETMGYQTGAEIMEKRKKIKRITTGSKTFDILLCKFTSRLISLVEGGVES